MPKQHIQGSRNFFHASFVILLLTCQSLSAQQTVQLPVVSSTSVNTTVSVPDRGSALLGGVSSAQSGRNQYGPIRPGTSTGLERRASSITAHVYIHDLQAMDEAILNSAPTRSSPLSTSIGNRSNSLLTREPATVSDESSASKAVRFERLAKQAENAHKTGVAKLHWQAAAKYGSKIAETRLAELNQSASVTTASPVSATSSAR